MSRLGRLLETFGLNDLHGAIKDALRLRAVGFDAVKHLLLCRIEKRPPKLDLDVYPYLPRTNVEAASTASYMALMTSFTPSIPNLIRPGPLPHPLPQGEGRASTATGCNAAPSPCGEGWGGGLRRKRRKPPSFPAGASRGVCACTHQSYQSSQITTRVVTANEAQRLVGGDLVYAVELEPDPAEPPPPCGEGWVGV